MIVNLRLTHNKDNMIPIKFLSPNLSFILRCLCEYIKIIQLHLVMKDDPWLNK